MSQIAEIISSKPVQLSDIRQINNGAIDN